MPSPSVRMLFLFVEPVSFISNPICAVVDELLVERQLQPWLRIEPMFSTRLEIVPPTDGARRRLISASFVFLL